MSEFECRFGHLMRPSAMFCDECEAEGIMNSKAIRMDGKTNRQMEAEEREDDYRRSSRFEDEPEEPEDDDEESDDEQEGDN